ncbi:ClC family H(+)/Cl(-) exchange transporter [Lacunimicrobium album]
MSSTIDEALPTPRGLLRLAFLSLIAGLAAGLTGALFRRLLERADAGRNAFIDWAHEIHWLGINQIDHAIGLCLVIGLASAATAFAAWLVGRFSPESSGSGIPHVEAVLKGEIAAAGAVLIPVKFLGGLLAMGSGLALGREGPTVQMGATIAHLIGRFSRLSPADARILLAAGAGAGLATAFNAPIAGSIFVLEELMRRFDTRITIATLGASATSIAISQYFLGVQPDFVVPELSYPETGSLIAYLVLGLFIGVLGVAYNWTILTVFAIAGRLTSIPIEVKAGVVGGLVGLLAWFAPGVVGGGEQIVQNVLDGKVVMTSLLVMVFAIRFLMGSISYAAGTPGGLFAPMLVLGAIAGHFYGAFATQLLPQFGSQTTPYIVTGMAAFFTAVVRSPVTGIILAIELTSSDTLLLPMLAACFTSMLVPTLVRNPPIYDSLGEIQRRK